MEELKYIRLTDEAKNYYSIKVLNIGYAAYCDGDTAFAASLLSIREDCLEDYFGEIGLTGDPNYMIDMDDDGRVFAYFNLEDDDEDELYDEFFGEPDDIVGYSA